MNQPTLMFSERNKRFLTGGFKSEFSEFRTPPSLHSTFNSSRAYSSSTASSALALCAPPKSTKFRISETLAKISMMVHEAQDDVSVVDHDSMLILSLTELLGELVHMVSQEDRTTFLEPFHLLLTLVNNAIQYIIIPTIERLRTRIAKFASDERILQITGFLSIVFSMAKEWRFELTFVEGDQVVKLLKVTKVLLLHYIKQQNRLSLYHDHTTAISNALLILIVENVTSIQKLLESIVCNSMPTHKVFEYLTNNIFRNHVHLSDIDLLDDFLKSFKEFNQDYSDSLQFLIQKELIKANYHLFLVNFEQFPENRGSLILYSHTWMQTYCEVYRCRDFEDATVIRRPSIGRLNAANLLINPGMAMRRLELRNFNGEELEQNSSPENEPLTPGDEPMFIITEDSSVELSVSSICQEAPIDSVVIYKKREEGSPRNERLPEKISDIATKSKQGNLLSNKHLRKKKSTSKVKGCWKCKLSHFIPFHKHCSQ